MLKISKEAYKKIKDHGISQSPEESCGILAGKKIDMISEVYPCTNIDDNPRSAYTVYPGELIQAINEIDSSSELVLIGFYHTHPFSNPSPSKADIEQATWDRHVYAIYSTVYDKMTFWRWFEDKRKFMEIDFLIE